MFSFLPQFLIVLSLAGIAIIIIRKSPEMKRLPASSLYKELGATIAQAVKYSAKKLWQFTLEVKELSKKGATLAHLPSLPKKFPKINLPKNPLNIFVPADSAKFHLQRARASLNKENFQEAEAELIKVIEKDPHNEEAFASLGKLYLSQNKLEEAIETYKFLIKHYPQNDTYHASLGQAYHNYKLYDKAIAAYERAIELDGKNARRYINLGLTLEAKKHLGEAILNYRRAVDLEQNNPQFLIILAEALTKKGDRAEAEAILQKILELEPTNHLAREKLMQLKY